MVIAQDKVLQILEEKITRFERLRIHASIDIPFGDEYREVYQATVYALGDVFGSEDAKNFRVNVVDDGADPWGQRGGESAMARDERYRAHLSACVRELRALADRVRITWPFPDHRDTPAAVQATSDTKAVFLAKSFAEQDSEITNYFERILTALAIPYKTGEKYSAGSIPSKVESRIDGSDVVIAIATRRKKKEDGGFTSPEWIHKEVAHAKAKSKQLIVLIEAGAEEPAGLRDTLELIQFDRDSISSMLKATTKFLEALKVQKLI